MDTTQTQTPAEAVLAELGHRAQNGEKVTPEELAGAHAALNLEKFERDAKERAEQERAKVERARDLSELHAACEKLEQDKTLEKAREKLGAALQSFAHACGDYEARRTEVETRISVHGGKFHAPPDVEELIERWQAIEKARMKRSVFLAAREALRPYYPRDVFDELTERSDY